MLPFDCTFEQYLSGYRSRHLIHGAADHWARVKPEALAVINATRGSTLSYRELAEGSRRLAAVLAAKGLKKGDFLATCLPFLDSLIVLEYACFRLGVVHVPLDLRLSAEELGRSFELVRPRAFVGLNKAAAPGGAEFVWDAGDLQALLSERAAEPTEWPEIGPEDAAQIIFTTGSTGRPKAALLSHRGITTQNLALGTAFEFDGQRVLVNLPPSHVGGQAEVLMTALFWGGTAVTLEVFDPGKSLEAMEKYKVQLIGQIPAMFLLEWRHSEFGQRDYSSLRTAVYGGQAVPRPFLDKMRGMAQRIGTGLGLTEASGFCTYTELTGDAGRVAAGIGYSLEIYPMTIREPMRADGSAGAELGAGEIGHVCFRGPQTFLGYLNDPESTAKAIASDGYLYTGDMGFVDGDGLHFSGRARWVIKPAGYQVFPGDVENHFCALSEQVAACGVVGVEHPIWVEAIVAFVERRAGAELTEAELRRHARTLTSYMRPLHYVIVDAGQLPLNRTAKLDTLRLKAMAEEEVRQLKLRGRWESVIEGQE